MKNTDQPRPRRRTTRWATWLDPNYTLSFGCEELHSVSFGPEEDFGGPRDVVRVQIPEIPNELFTAAMAFATESWAQVVFVCDTTAQAGKAASRAEKMLPNHRCVSIERAFQ